MNTFDVRESWYTVNVAGNQLDRAEEEGYHAHYASGVTAIEIKASDERTARNIAHMMGMKVLYIFE